MAGVDRPGQGAGVADAGGAAVADEVEAQLVQERREAGAVEVAGHGAAAGGEAGLDPRRGGQALLHRLLGEEAGPDHHRRVGGVGAAGDGGDRHRAGLERERLAVHGHVHGLVVRAGAVGDQSVGEVLPELAGHGAELHPVLRAPRAGEARHDGGQVELERLVELGVRVGVGAEQALCLGVRLGQRDRLRRPAGDLHVAEGLVVDREHRRGRAELGRHVRDRRAVGEGQAGEAGAVELHELPDDPVVAQHLRDRQDEVGGGGARRRGGR